MANSPFRSTVAGNTSNASKNKLGRNLFIFKLKSVRFHSVPFGQSDVSAASVSVTHALYGLAVTLSAPPHKWCLPLSNHFQNFIKN